MKRPPHSRFFLALFAAALGASSSAHAASSEWKMNDHGRLRLIAPYAVAPASGPISFGIQFQPRPGWHVYWKDAGDFGYGPRFDFSRSEGLRDLEVRYPRPRRFILPGDIHSFGYENEVVYPVHAIAAAKAGTLRLRVKIDYLTCEESCVPYEYNLSLSLPAGSEQPDPPLQALLTHYENQVPAVPLTPDDITEDSAASPRSRASLGWMLLFAFLGGLILNLMPCVLPVLSIKLFGLLQHVSGRRIQVIGYALASAAGILVSFLGLALAVVLAKNAGSAAGWGIQFQQPVFVAGLALLVGLFALNLWGIFEIQLPAFINRLGAAAGSEEGLVPHFFSGILATVLATPCSAPFLGTAMGFAIAQPAAVIFSIFAATGAGLAFPYAALALFPGLLKKLPKPGPWMRHLKVILGFLLAATAVWLGYVLAGQITRIALAGFVLTGLGLSYVVWLKEQVAGPASGRSAGFKLVFWGAMLSLTGLALAIVSHRDGKTAARSSAGVSAYEWVPFDEKEIARLTAAGQIVFVDVTADWCFTCKYNERFVLETEEVTAAFRARDVVMMRADWTNQNDAIYDYLVSFNRRGIPFYALYVPGQSPRILSEILTKARVLEILNSI